MSEEQSTHRSDMSEYSLSSPSRQRERLLEDWHNHMARELNKLGYVVAKVEHVGWQSTEDHSLEPLDTDEDYQPPGTHPVWVLREVRGMEPSLDEFEHMTED